MTKDNTINSKIQYMVHKNKTTTKITKKLANSDNNDNRMSGQDNIWMKYDHRKIIGREPTNILYLDIDGNGISSGQESRKL